MKFMEKIYKKINVPETSNLNINKEKRQEKNVDFACETGEKRTIGKEWKKKERENKLTRTVEF